MLEESQDAGEVTDFEIDQAELVCVVESDADMVDILR